MRLTLASAAETVRLGETIGRALRAGDLVLLRGELGAGKTTLVRGLARAAGFRGLVSSPTFALAHRYRGRRLTVHHLDLYRLRDGDVGELGLDELLADPRGAVVVEWPDAAPSWPRRRVEVTLAHARTGRTARVRDRRGGAVKERTVLAVDATGDDLTAALSARGRTWTARRSPRVPHDESLLPAVESLLKKARVSWKDLDAVAAAAGPGRFTGIRVGLAFAAVVGLERAIPALALSRLEAAAERCGADRVLASLPGWKGEVYHQEFRRGRAGLKAAGPARWTAPEAWPAVRAAAESRGWTASHGATSAADLLPVAARRLAARDVPPFEPFYLKPAGYEKPRR